MTLRRLVLTLALLTLLAAPAAATTYTTYSYTGDHFGTQFGQPLAEGIYSTADSVRGSFTVPDDFVAVHTHQLPLNYTPGVVNYLFTDGHQTLTERNSTSEIFWELVPALTGLHGEWRLTFWGLDGGRISTEATGWFRGDRGALDASNFGFNASTGWSDGSHAGTWAVAMPEPASLLLTLAGLGAIVGARWRWRA